MTCPLAWFSNKHAGQEQTHHACNQVGVNHVGGCCTSVECLPAHGVMCCTLLTFLLCVGGLNVRNPQSEGKVTRREGVSRNQPVQGSVAENQGATKAIGKRISPISAHAPPDASKLHPPPFFFAPCKSGASLLLLWPVGFDCVTAYTVTCVRGSEQHATQAPLFCFYDGLRPRAAGCGTVLLDRLRPRP
jgi:hypothetical protein